MMMVWVSSHTFGEEWVLPPGIARDPAPASGLVPPDFNAWWCGLPANARKAIQMVERCRSWDALRGVHPREFTRIRGVGHHSVKTIINSAMAEGVQLPNLARPK